MNSRESPTEGLIPPERLAEAAVWIARLHGEERGRAIEQGFKRWLQEDPLNARAFELATEVWNDAAKLRIPSQAAVARPQSAVRFKLTFAALTAVAVLMVGIGVTLRLREDGVGTAVGEQRLLTLEDGTQIYLNTSTRVVVSYDKTTRRVELQAGEAIFHVAKKPDWPFVVTAGDRQVKALGTSFIVRRDEQRVAVTLMEGKVVVSSVLSTSSSLPVIAGEGSVDPAAHEPAASGEATPNEVFMMAPGQRLTFTAGGATQLDTPSLDKTTAWRRGQVVLDDTPLSAAVVEMNRYNSVKLVIEDPQASRLLVNGLFQAGDSMSFAKAVAHTYGLSVIERDGEIVLAGGPNH